jgi:hypothetical protein
VAASWPAMVNPASGSERDDTKPHPNRKTYHKVPSTSNTIPFRGGASDARAGSRGANLRGRRWEHSAAEAMIDDGIDLRGERDGRINGCVGKYTDRWRVVVDT